MKTGLTRSKSEPAFISQKQTTLWKSAPTIQASKSGCKTFAVKKGRFGIRLTAPYSEKRRQAASELAKKNTQNLRRTAK